MVRPSESVAPGVGRERPTAHGTPPAASKMAPSFAASALEKPPAQDVPEALPPPRPHNLSQPGAALSHVLAAPASRLAVEFLTHRPDMLGLSAAHLVYGLRALQRKSRGNKADPREIERWVGRLLGVDPQDVRWAPARAAEGLAEGLTKHDGLAEALAKHVEAELSSCGLYAILAKDLHSALPRPVLAELHRAAQSGAGWLAFKRYPESCLARGLGAAAHPSLHEPVSAMAQERMEEALLVVPALSPGLDAVSLQEVAREVAGCFDRSAMRALQSFAQTAPGRAWLDLQPALRDRAESVFQRPEVQLRLVERLRRVAVPARFLKLQ